MYFFSRRLCKWRSALNDAEAERFEKSRTQRFSVDGRRCVYDSTSAGEGQINLN